MLKLFTIIFTKTWIARSSGTPSFEGEIFCQKQSNCNFKLNKKICVGLIDDIYAFCTSGLNSTHKTSQYQDFKWEFYDWVLIPASLIWLHCMSLVIIVSEVSCSAFQVFFFVYWGNYFNKQITLRSLLLICWYFKFCGVNACCNYTFIRVNNVCSAQYTVLFVFCSLFNRHSMTVKKIWS